MVESFLIRSYDNVLLKTFAWKNSYSENSQDKKMCRESPFWVPQPKTLRFLLIRFSLFWLYPSGYSVWLDLQFVTLLKRSRRVNNRKYDSFHALFLIDEIWHMVSFVAEASSFTAGIIIYLNFDSNKISLFV